jgi:tRNA(fMet)-specific endonuclease VapC
LKKVYIINIYSWCVEESSVGISVISISEISSGLEKLKDEYRKKSLLQASEYIFSSIKILEFNDEAAWLYGKIRTALCDAGQDIGVMDTLIASHALSQKLILVSNNVKHFKRVPDLKVENWVKLASNYVS